MIFGARCNYALIQTPTRFILSTLQRDKIIQEFKRMLVKGREIMSQLNYKVKIKQKESFTE
jgi:hypothetical protein